MNHTKTRLLYSSFRLITQYQPVTKRHAMAHISWQGGSSLDQQRAVLRRTVQLWAVKINTPSSWELSVWPRKIWGGTRTVSTTSCKHQLGSTEVSAWGIALRKGEKPHPGSGAEHLDGLAMPAGGLGGVA